MKKRIYLISALVLIASLWHFGLAYALHSDAFTFFIPLSADDLKAFFESGPQQTAVGTLTVNGVDYTISISVLRDGTLIYYDEWEDGLEPNITVPTQASTKVWGDNDTTNGSPPGFGSDQLTAGDVITLKNLVAVPRNPAVLAFDGGDKVVSVGGALAVTVTPWPDVVPVGGGVLVDGILFGDASELFPTSRWGQVYVAPVGQDVPRPQGGFTIVGLNIQAVEDGTSVQVADKNGNPIASATLGQGQQLTVPSGVPAGAQVTTTGGPVQVHLLTKDPNSTYESRSYTMVPFDEWGSQYLAPRSSDGDYWLYNPDTASLDVQVQTTAGVTTITIPAQSAGRYPPLPAPVLATRTGALFTSTDGRPFYGVVSLDSNDVQDWGYALLPIENLSSQALVGWAPGNNCSPPGPSCGGTGLESRVYVTAATTTTLFVDFDSNGTPDGAPIVVNPLAEVFITDSDFDMTGARLYTDGQPFIAVWGQDLSAPDALPSIDVGTLIIPLQAPSIQKVYTLVEEGYNCGTLTRSDRVRFQLLAYNDSVNEVSVAVVEDVLQPGFTYVPNTTLVDGAPLPDSGSTPFPLDEGGADVGPIPGLGVASITFDATIPNPGVFPNQTEFLTPTGLDLAGIEVSAPLRVAGYQVTKTLVDPPSGLVDPGQVITFNVTITNTGTVTITQLPLVDRFNVGCQDCLTFLSASVTPDAIVATQAITWNNLAPAGLLPGQALPLTLSFTVANPLPTNAVRSINVALADGVRGTDGVGQARQAIVCDEAVVPFAAPTPTPTPTRPPSTPDRGPDPTSTPIRVTPPPSAVVTPTPAVFFLPETGVGNRVSGTPVWPWVVLPGLGLLGWAIFRRRGK